MKVATSLDLTDRAGGSVDLRGVLLAALLALSACDSRTTPPAPAAQPPPTAQGAPGAASASSSSDGSGQGTAPSPSAGASGGVMALATAEPSAEGDWWTRGDSACFAGATVSHAPSEEGDPVTICVLPDGTSHGPATFYRPQSREKEKEGSYVRGKPCGTWTFWEPGSPPRTEQKKPCKP